MTAHPRPSRREPLDPALDAGRLAELTRRISRSPDLDTLVGTAVDGARRACSATRNSILLLLDERGERLYTIASHGYDAEGVGSEVTVGEGIIGVAAARCRPIRVGNLRQMAQVLVVRPPVVSSATKATWPGPRHPAARAARRPEPARRPRPGPRRAGGRAGRGEPRRTSPSTTPTKSGSPWWPLLVANAVEVERARAGSDAGAAPGPPVTQPGAGDRGGDARPVLRRRRQHVPRPRLPDQGRGRPHPLGAAPGPRRATAAPSSPTGRSASTRRSSCRSSATTSRAGSSC